jgi:hypothetical protein
MAAEFYSSDLFPTLEAAREWLQKMVWEPKGAICPCCDRFDNVYDRHINQPAVRNLTLLYRHSKANGDGYHHYTDFIADLSESGLDFSKFAHHDLIERKPLDPQNKKQKTSGMYRITERGIAFVESRLAIPAKTLIYHNEVVGMSDEQQTIREFWPNFDYQELMNT